MDEKEIETTNRLVNELHDRIHKAHCLNCYHDQPYEIRTRTGQVEIRGRTVEFEQKYAVCSVCGEDMYVPEVSFSNVKVVQEAYDKLMLMEAGKK